MSKIFKTATENTDNVVLLSDFDGYVSQDDITRIKSFAETLTDDALVEERELIEKCAEANKTYLYNANWDENSIKQIKEYAMVCKCKTSGINPKDEKFLQKISECDKITKQASVATKEPENKLLGIFDPFKLNEAYDTSYLNKNREWEKPSAELKLSKPISTNARHSIASIGGGEDYNTMPHLNVRRGQNSVSNPNAIENIAQDDDQDVGVRLRNEKKNKETKRKSEIVASEKQIVQDAEKNGFGTIAMGKVTMTESLNAQTGLKNKNIFGLDAEEFTSGEKLASKNEQRKASIQREKVKDERTWDSPQSEAKHEISSVFSEQLKENLKKIQKQ